MTKFVVKYPNTAQNQRLFYIQNTFLFRSKWATYPYIINGTYNGKEYHTDAALRVGWESDYSPYSVNFDKEFIKRIRAYDNEGVDFDIEYNFNFLKDRRYISDGNVNTIVIPSDLQEYLDNTYNLEVITY